jgi:hypothetical protein
MANTATLTLASLTPASLNPNPLLLLCFTSLPSPTSPPTPTRSCVVLCLVVELLVCHKLDARTRYASERCCRTGVECSGAMVVQVRAHDHSHVARALGVAASAIDTHSTRHCGAQDRRLGHYLTVGSATIGRYVPVSKHCGPVVGNLLPDHVVCILLVLDCRNQPINQSINQLQESLIVLY